MQILKSQVAAAAAKVLWVFAVEAGHQIRTAGRNTTPLTEVFDAVSSKLEPEIEVLKNAIDETK